ncbi:MAG: hypothetical protein N3A38_10630 [Planctomycetota bacterium]|nr:hypothetical protein [Planctomycetota bacterium]
MPAGIPAFPAVTAMRPEDCSVEGAALKKVADLERALSDFDAARRRAAIEELAALMRSGAIQRHAARAEVNLHFHSFFSFNAEGWSPSRIAWEAAKYGLEVAGCVDFDVLDGVAEFLDAGDLLELKTVAGIETRVFVREYSDRELNSPGEPGIAYYMGAGCVRVPAGGSAAGEALRALREMARERTGRMAARVSGFLGRIRLDCERDVLPLTPSGNATERHLLAAYDRKAREEFRGDESVMASFWAEKLRVPVEEIRAILNDTPKFHERIRGALMKRGGVGYEKPDAGRFPTLDSFTRTVQETGALPVYAWLDGTSPGESDAGTLFEFMSASGAEAVNIIPERNWNIPDPDVKRLKIRKLHEAIAAAEALDLPILVGTEMNRAGQPFVDRFDAPELLPFREAFLAGARFLYGHTLLSRVAGLGAAGTFARDSFRSRRERNAFYARVGSAPKPSGRTLDRLRTAAEKGDAGAILIALEGGTI